MSAINDEREYWRKEVERIVIEREALRAERDEALAARDLAIREIGPLAAKAEALTMANETLTRELKLCRMAPIIDASTRNAALAENAKLSSQLAEATLRVRQAELLFRGMLSVSIQEPMRRGHIEQARDFLASLEESTAPGHTDLMVSPETLDDYMKANPLPAQSQGEVCERCQQETLCPHGVCNHCATLAGFGCTECPWCTCGTEKASECPYHGTGHSKAGGK